MGDAMEEHGADRKINAESAEVARREAELLAREYLTLDEPTREAVRAIAGECRRSGNRQEQVFAGGDLYAYAHPRGGIAWGVNDARGINIARGVERLPADLPPRVADLDDLRQLVMAWRRIDVGAALAEPASAKALLARANAEANAGAAWQHSLDAQDRGADEARWLVNIGETRRQLIHNVVQSQAVHPDWRASFQCAAPNCLILQTSEHFDTRRALIVAMRRRPDRIIVGEVRGGEARTLIEAWNTGHAGGIATVHANGARAGLIRLEMLCSIGGAPNMQQAIAHAVDLLVFIAPTPAGRRITEILAVTGYADGQYLTSPTEADHA
jgi:hypothetical protein